MDYKRLLLYVALAFVLVTLWDAWHKDHPPVNQAIAVGQAQLQPIANSSAVPTSTVVKAPSTALINVHTDVLDVKIDPKGGNIVQANLLAYPLSYKTPHAPIQLLNTNPDTFYIAENGLIGPQGPDTQQSQAIYTPEATSYTLGTGQDKIDVKLNWHNDAGLNITKILSFARGKYDIPIQYQIENNSPQAWSGQVYGQMRRKPEEAKGGLFSLHTYDGGTISTVDKAYEKVSYRDMQKANLNRATEGGWLALQQRYFLSALIPDSKQLNQFYSSFDPNQKIYTLGYLGPKIDILPKARQILKSTFYVGPELTHNLKALAPHLDLTIDYGWLWAISDGIFWIMQIIYKWVGNWGWSIVLVTLLIKLIFYKLSETSYRSMAKMRDLAPRLQAIKERYGEDRNKMSQATMELYKKEKVNPLVGCLPMLIQIPFFIALYYVLIENVEFRQAPFILWIHDLSVKDPYYVLPILMGLSMFLQQKLNPPPADPMQAKVMMFLPIIFTVLFLTFPAGLVLYWLANNCFSILQQWYIMRRYEKHKVKTRR